MSSGLGSIEQANPVMNHHANPTRPAQDFARALSQEPGLQVSLVRPFVNHVERQTQADAPSKLPIADEGMSLAGVDAVRSAPEVADVAATSLAQPVTPVGVTEAFLGARVYGLHLTAQSYLSELAAIETEAILAGPVVACPSTVTMAIDAAASADGATSTWNGQAGIERGSEALPPVVAEMEPVPSKLLELPFRGELMLSMFASASGEASSWSERVLRLSRDGGKGVTAWLRDYRLDEAERDQMLDALIAYAHERGIALKRIVLNGREVWATANITSEEADHHVG